LSLAVTTLRLAFGIADSSGCFAQTADLAPGMHPLAHSFSSIYKHNLRRHIVRGPSLLEGFPQSNALHLWSRISKQKLYSCIPREYYPNHAATAALKSRVKWGNETAEWQNLTPGLYRPAPKPFRAYSGLNNLTTRWLRCPAISCGGIHSCSAPYNTWLRREATSWKDSNISLYIISFADSALRRQ